MIILFLYRLQLGFCPNFLHLRLLSAVPEDANADMQVLYRVGRQR